MKSPTSALAFRPVVLPSPFLRRACRLLLRSFARIPHPNALFSIACSLFSENTRVGGYLSAALCHSDFQTFELSGLQTQFCPRLFSTSYKSLPVPPRRKNPLFSYTYKSIFAQLLCFHIHTKPPGVTTRKSGSTCHPRGYPMSIPEGSQRILPAQRMQ